MKNWLDAELVELSVSETAQGGKTFRNIDKTWFDENNEIVADYES